MTDISERLADDLTAAALMQKIEVRFDDFNPFVFVETCDRLLVCDGAYWRRARVSDGRPDVVLVGQVRDCHGRDISPGIILIPATTTRWTIAGPPDGGDMLSGGLSGVREGRHGDQIEVGYLRWVGR